VLDQPTDQPACWKQKPSIREVVVLPLVPVTATTGIVGRMSSGARPGSAWANRCAARSITSNQCSLSTAFRAFATPSASTSARPELRHG
jgi:hypothetical protein